MAFKVLPLVGDLLAICLWTSHHLGRESFRIHSSSSISGVLLAA